MKITFFGLLVICFGMLSFANGKDPISVAANDDTTVSFFFPEVIMKVITPASHFVFEYEENGTMGTLKAQKGAASNLTVITKEGRIYSFLLRYEKEISNFTYVLSPEESIGMLPVADPSEKTSEVAEQQESPKAVVGNENTVPDTIVSKEVTETEVVEINMEDANKDHADYVAAYPANLEETNARGGFKPSSGGLYEVDKRGYYDIFCENNYDQKVDFEAYGNTVNRIRVQVNNIIADRDELYFVLEIQNTSWSDYQLKQLQFFVKTRELQTKLQVEELYTYNLPKTVPVHSNHRFVVVCKKFKLGTDQTVYAVLDEQGGRQRSVILPLEREGINRL